MLLRILIFCSVALAGCAFKESSTSQPSLTRTLLDHSRDREIPLEIQLPPARFLCTKDKLCPVAFISPGYGLYHTNFSFIAKPLVESGYMVVSIQGVLPSDPKLPNTGNIVVDRTPMWTRAAESLLFVKRTLAPEFNGYDWDDLILIGASNGGDYSALAASQNPHFSGTLITLDNRRYPLPTNKSIKLMSLRGSDFQADAGVLPTQEYIATLGYCIKTIPESKHNDMQDAGPEWLKNSISTAIINFLVNRHCGT
jgi:hypothetical protein